MRDPLGVSLIWETDISPKWRLARFGSVVNEVRDPNLDGRWRNRLSLSYGRIIPRDIESSDGLLPESFNTYNRVVPNDIVLRLTDLQNDKRSLRTAIADESGIVTSAYVSVRPHAIEPRFLAYYLRAADLAKLFYSMGGGLRQSIGFGDIKAMGLPLPPRNEQRAIADYLDHETAEIDAFIGDLEVGNLLVEERLAHEYSRELHDRDWPRVPLKRALSDPLKYGVSASADQNVEGDIRYLRITDFANDGELREGVRRTLPRSVARDYLVRPGDVLIARSGATAGKAFIVPEDFEAACFAGYLVQAKPSLRTHPRFLWHALRSREYKVWVELNSTVATIPNIGAQTLSQYPVPYPEYGVQEQVAARLDDLVTATREMQRHIRLALSLIKERRAALISAAVTGQIDVTERHKPVAEVLEDEVREMV